MDPNVVSCGDLQAGTAALPDSLPVEGTSSNPDKFLWVEEIKCRYDNPKPKVASSIYKWPTDLANSSTLAGSTRMPHTISFGPYHHGEEHLLPMEPYKERALHRILEGSQKEVCLFLDSLRGIEKELRDSYDDEAEIERWPSESFLKMMLLDGCFMLEVLRCSAMGAATAGDCRSVDPVLSCPLATFLRDMLMIENQIPFLVLDRLNRVLNDDNRATFTTLGLHFLDAQRNELIGIDATIAPTPTVDSASALADFATFYGTPKTGEPEKRQVPCGAPSALASILSKPKPPGEGSCRLLSATELCDAGVSFKKSEKGGMQIEFNEERAVLTLPFICIDDITAATYTNLIAYERMHPRIVDKQVTSYVKAMVALIDTAEDVRFLSANGILWNLVRREEDAAELFSNLRTGIVLYGPFINDEKHIKKLMKRKRRVWRSINREFRQKYFRDRWTLFSTFIGGFLVLYLAVVQTVFAVLTFYSDGK